MPSRLRFVSAPRLDDFASRMGHLTPEPSSVVGYGRRDRGRCFIGSHISNGWFRGAWMLQILGDPKGRARLNHFRRQNSPEYSPTHCNHLTRSARVRSIQDCTSSLAHAWPWPRRLYQQARHRTEEQWRCRWLRER